MAYDYYPNYGNRGWTSGFSQIRPEDYPPPEGLPDQQFSRGIPSPEVGAWGRARSYWSPTAPAPNAIMGQVREPGVGYRPIESRFPFRDVPQRPAWGRIRQQSIRPMPPMPNARTGQVRQPPEQEAYQALTQGRPQAAMGQVRQPSPESMAYQAQSQMGQPRQPSPEQAAYRPQGFVKWGQNLQQAQAPAQTSSMSGGAWNQNQLQARLRQRPVQQAQSTQPNDQAQQAASRLAAWAKAS